MNFEETIRYGESQYSDVIITLAQHGLEVSFTQTGGMNAALEATLDGGAYLMITDEEESLAWERPQHAGWGVSLYRDIEDREEPLAYTSSSQGDVLTLVALVRTVLDAGSRTNTVTGKR